MNESVKLHSWRADDGKVALLDGTCVGEIDWLTDGDFDAQSFVHDARGRHAQ